MDTGTSSKIGVSQMFIAAVTKYDYENGYEDISDKDLVNFDEMYHNETLEELQEAVKNVSFETFKVKEELPPVPVEEAINIVDILSNRTSRI